MMSFAKKAIIFYCIHQSFAVNATNRFFVRNSRHGSYRRKKKIANIFELKRWVIIRCFDDAFVEKRIEGE